MALPDGLERLVHAELRRLPLPRAPHTLLPRVMAAVDRWARRPWYAREWFTWPLGWQAASVALLAALLAAGAILLPGVQDAARALTATRPVTDVLAAAASLIETVDTAVSLTVTLWRALVRPVALYAFVLATLLCLACAGFGAALGRVALGRAVPP
jgi:hypothetical protein